MTMKSWYQLLFNIWLTGLTVAAQQKFTSLTGSFQYSVSSDNDESTWIITPANPASSKIQIIFTALSILQAEIRIYDTSLTNTGTLVFGCASCGALIPPPFYSTTGSVTVHVTGITGVSFRPSSLALQYVAVPVTETVKLNNTYVKLNVGAASIKPYLFNNQLPAEYVQKWAIQQAASVQLVFSFSSFVFGTGCDAQLTIYDAINSASAGNILFQGCRSADIPSGWLYSSTGAALVVLTTTARAAVDFQLNYFSDTELYRCGSFVQPALITDDSMIIADGSKSTELMKFSTDCSWKIASPKQVPVSLTMNRVSLKFGSSVKVYDGSSESGTLLWDANGNTETVPPVITSTENALFIRYRSDSSNSVRYKGFEGDYALQYEGSLGAGKGYTQLQMSSALDIQPPGDGVTHTADITYIWYVAPVRASGPITFAITQLNLLQPGDRLTLLEGVTGNTGGDMGGPIQDTNVGSRQVLATFSGSEIPTDWVRTTGTSATVIFESTNPTVTAGENFKLSFFADGPNYHCGFTTNPAKLTSPSFIITDGSSSLESAYQSQDCVWEISPTGARYVMLIFQRFDLFDGSLQIYTGAVRDEHLYIEVSGTSAPPAPMLIEAATINLVYTTVNKVTGYGFSLTYYGVASSLSFPGDRLVTLTSSSVVSLTLPLGRTDAVEPDTSLKWIIAPSQSSGRTYLAITMLNLDPDCVRSSLKVYDGTDISAPLLGQFCGTSLPISWLQTSSQSALVHFESDSTTDSRANFELTYYSDGPSFHCGFAINPARMTGHSMVLTDGSGSANPMFPDQLCEWVIDIQDNNHLIVIEFLECDMLGGSIILFDGASDSSDVLWSCEDCSNIPGQIISAIDKVFVRYSSRSSGPFGNGFRAVYWTVQGDQVGSSISSSTTPLVLQLPAEFTMTSEPTNTSAAFELNTITAHFSLSFSPFYSIASQKEMTVPPYDGRPDSDFDADRSKKAICGAVLNAGSNSLVSPAVVSKATQRLDRYLISTAASKTISEIVGTARDTSLSYESQVDSSHFTAPSVCKYRLDSGTFQAVSIIIENFSPRLNGHLRIYAGLDNQDALLYDSAFPRQYIRQGSYRERTVEGHQVQSANLTAPCGQATIILEVNSTDLGVVGGMVDYSLHLIYHAIATDNGEICSAYFRSLQPKPKEADPNIPIYISLGAVFGFSIILACMYYAGKLKASQGYLFYPYNYQPRRVKIIKAAPAHPKYSGKWDKYLNKFLRKGECCVCKNSHLAVLRLGCSHALCFEDIKGYLESALGDVSQFPVKCPMHFQGCDGVIDSRVAKRVLTEPQYIRFTEFCDRALYGDGMRCIFCCNYVNFPENMEHVARVVCPYCAQYFCIRCKKAWHASNRCAVDTYDESLEVWKNTSGAQKCPACKKLIEKDDPDTCNHMVHKITDGIPCIRDRTDFCYCCGEEVTSDYPHAEVHNKSINHFPDGVFQRCRKIVQQEKDAERERLRRIRRMKTKVVPFGQSQTAGAVAGGELDSPITSPLVGNTRNFAITAPSSGNTNVEAMWLLEQQYDIEPTPAGSPSRPASRSMASTPTGMMTPMMTPSPGRVVPVVSDVWNDGLDSPGAGSGRVRTANNSRNTSSRGRVVPVNGAIAPSAGSAGSNAGAGIAARPFPMLEQQVMYQHQVMTSNRAAAGATSIHGSASSPQLLLGSPQQHRNRGRP